VNIAGAGTLLSTLDENDVAISKYPTEEKREVGKGNTVISTKTFKLNYCCTQLINQILGHTYV
jgi:hypothetical protein